jgi:hypothetical protein
MYSFENLEIWQLPFCDKIEAKIREFRSTLNKGRIALKKKKRKGSSVKR